MSKTIVDADGTLITAIGFGSKAEVLVESTDPELIRLFHENAELGVSVSIVHLAQPFTAGYATPLEVATALCGVRPGRTAIMETSPDVIKAIKQAMGPQSSGIVY